MRIAKYFFYFALTGAIFVTVLITYLMWLQPAFYFPQPTGPYAIGTKTYHWIDTQRKDTRSNDPIHPYQELMVKIWYPSTLKLRRAGPSDLSTLQEKSTMPYAPYLFAHLKATRPLAWLFSGASRHIYTYEIPNGAIAPDKPHYPVVLFSPGGGGRYDSNSAHCQELASYGYIVVGISHPYDSVVIQFPDGRIKTAPINTIQSKSFIERRKLHDQEIIEERVADVRFVLDQLETLMRTKESIFYERLDREHIGIFGQSLGGSTAVAVCRRDSRVKAGVDMDGSLFGSDATTSFEKPFMFIAAGESVKIFDDPNFQNIQKVFDVHSPQEVQMLKERYIQGYQKIAANKKDKYIFVIKGAGHIDLTDNALLIKHAAPVFSRPIIKMAFVGPLGYGSIDGFRVTEIVNAYLVNFFDKYLKGQPSKLLNGKDNQYAEVKTIH